VPKVRPVLIRSVAKAAWRGAARRASGATNASFGASFAATRSARIPRFAKTAPSDTLSPPLRKKNGVRKANATTRRRFCSSRCSA